MNKVKIIRSVFFAELALIIPFIATQFSNGWDWKLHDYIIASILLAGIGLAFVLIIDGIKGSPTKVIIGSVLSFTLVLIWIQFAVGIID